MHKTTDKGISNIAVSKQMFTVNIMGYSLQVLNMASAIHKGMNCNSIHSGSRSNRLGACDPPCLLL